MVYGFQQWQDRPGHQACPLQMMHGIQTCSAADIARELDIHWVTKNPTGENRGHCMGLSVPFLFLLDMLHWTKRTVFGAETWLITQNLKLEKGCMIEKLSSSSSKANESVISKDDHGKLSGDHKHVLVLYFLHHGDSLLIVIVVHLPNCACFLQKVSVTLPKYWPFAWKCQASHTQVDSCLWLYIWDVMDQSHSCTHCFISHWILEKHLAGKWFH